MAHGRLEGLGERRKLSQRGPGRNPGRKRILVHFELEKNESGDDEFDIFVSRLGCGSAISSPSRVRGGTPAENGFWCTLYLKNKSGDNEFDIFPQWLGEGLGTLGPLWPLATPVV